MSQKLKLIPKMSSDRITKIKLLHFFFAQPTTDSDYSTFTFNLLHASSHTKFTIWLQLQGSAYSHLSPLCVLFQLLFYLSFVVYLSPAKSPFFFHHKFLFFFSQTYWLKHLTLPSSHSTQNCLYCDTENSESKIYCVDFSQERLQFTPLLV